VSLVDLTQPFSDGMFNNRRMPVPKVERTLTIEEHGLNITCCEFAVHTGTHIDAPVHFLPDGRSIEQLPLEHTHGTAVGWAVERGPGEAITVADLEARTPRCEPGDIVSIHTGWGRFFGDHERYRDHPHLSVDAAAWLVERGVKLAIFDLPTPDLPEGRREPGFDWPAHKVLLRGGALIAEHAANLDQVVGHRFSLWALPIPIVGSDGAPARIVADLTTHA
jgi:kynurenine formamidase